MLDNDVNVTNVEESQDELSQMKKALEKERAKVKNLEMLLHPIKNIKDNPFENVQYGKTFRDRILYQIFLCKDTSNPMSSASVENSVDIISKVIESCNKLKNRDRVISFRDADYNLDEIRILDIFSGAFIPNEVSEDFDNLDSERFTLKSTLPLGHVDTSIMPTFSEYEEAMHSLKGLFKRYNENYVSLSSLHSTMNVSQYMRECAIKVGDKFHVARRPSADKFFIPFYSDKLNCHLFWKEQYYNDFASKYIDEYFNIYVYDLLRGKRD
jgi:hypothetical protein